MYEYSEKTGSEMNNTQQEGTVYPTGGPLHKTKEDIRPLPKEARPEQEKKSDLHYVGESSKGVKKTNMSAVKDNKGKSNEKEKEQVEEELIERTTWETPQPEKDKNLPL